MLRLPDQILTVAQMRAAEDCLIAKGSSVDELMQRAGRGAADWVWRLAGQHRVTVLCGPGNNGGDGYVIAQALHERGGAVTVIAASEPKTAAARTARALYQGEVLGAHSAQHGDILVDCLFGSGLTRPLTDETLALFQQLAARHHRTIAIDLPSGVDADSGALLNPGLPACDLTLALGAWKFAHYLMPASATMGAPRLVDIGVEQVEGAVTLIARPKLHSPAADAHKYRRGMLGVVGGAIPGAALLACTAAQGAGAGYVKLLSLAACAVPNDLVVETSPLESALADRRFGALLVGPGLGRDATARSRLKAALACTKPLVLDADALVLLEAQTHLATPVIATPHEGELAALEKTFQLEGPGSKAQRTAALARASGMILVAKGPDSVIAAPDGRMALAPRASSWLSVAGTGDILAGTIASRLACGSEPFQAACEGLWLHGAAARLCGAAFTASQLASKVQDAYAACL